MKQASSTLYITGYNLIDVGLRKILKHGCDSNGGPEKTIPPYKSRY
jgi:hypothetical protein